MQICWLCRYIIIYVERQAGSCKFFKVFVRPDPELNYSLKGYRLVLMNAEIHCIIQKFCFYKKNFKRLYYNIFSYDFALDAWLLRMSTT